VWKLNIVFGITVNYLKLFFTKLKRRDGMKNQFPIRILIMGAVATSSSIHANHSNGDDEYWNVQWNAEPKQEREAIKGAVSKKSGTSSPQFFSIDQPEESKTSKVQTNNDDDWGLELALQKDEDKTIAQSDPIVPLNTIETITDSNLNPSVQPVPVQEQKTIDQPQTPKTILINFNNVSIVEYIRFISRISGKNFIFDEKELGFNVTIVSDGPTTIQNVMTALLQELRAHGYSMMEEANTIIIYKNDEVRNVGKVSINEVPAGEARESELVTQVFKLNTLDPVKASTIIRPLLSKQALMEVSSDTRQIIITDLISNIQQTSILLKGLDSPNGGQVIGQYVVRNALIDNLIDLTKQIMAPIASDQPITFVPHPSAQSIFIIASPFLVERSLSVLQHLDQRKGENKIFNLEDLKFTPLKGGDIQQLPTEQPTTTGEGGAGAGGPPIRTAGRWEIDPEGKWVFHPGGSQIPGELPQGRWVLDPQGNWYFIPEGSKAPFSPEGERNGAQPVRKGDQPRGKWQKDESGKWAYELLPGESIRPEYLRRDVEHQENLPVGHIERTKFLLYKLKYRNGKDIVIAIENIGKSLEDSGVINKDLSLSIGTLQWIEPTNSIIITGTSNSIQKIRELIDELDSALKQVFIEMLILETDIDNSLQFGVSWGTRSGGGSTSTAQAFLSGATSLAGNLFGRSGLNAPEAGAAAPPGGFSLGVIGRRLTHNGIVFADIGALVRFVHDKVETNIVMNPKVITEDNKPAEFFVGINTAFQNESIANDQGSIITTNFQFRDVGTTLNVTPHIGSNDLINLEIKLENSSVSTGTTSTAGQNQTNAAPAGPTTSINRTTTNVNIPDGYFLILSGMIQDQLVTTTNQVPCLGGIPGLGAAFKTHQKQDTKRNLMIFIRPVIVNSDEQMNVITKRQQEIFQQKNRTKDDWKYHMDQALDWLNLREGCDPCEPCIE
jgi:type III secretion protein C